MTMSNDTPNDAARPVARYHLYPGERTEDRCECRAGFVEELPSGDYVLFTDYDKLREEVERLRALVNSPELYDFAKGVTLEAAHQRERWGVDHDAGKEPQDWFWLVGYLGGKALRAHLDGNSEKALHHTISTAAALCNWHGAIIGTHNMRPGIDGEAALTAALGREGGGNG